MNSAKVKVPTIREDNAVKREEQWRCGVAGAGASPTAHAVYPHYSSRQYGGFE